MAFYDDGAAPTTDDSFGGSLFQVLTHVAAIVIAIDFARRGKYYAMAVALLIDVSSPMYHICKATWYCFGLTATSVFGLTGLERLRLLDHISSMHAPGAILLIAALGESGGGELATAYRVLLLAMAGFAVVTFPFQSRALVVILAFASLVVFFEYVWIRRGRPPLRQRFSSSHAIAALGTGLLAIVCYLEPPFMPPDISHGLWHLFIFASLWHAVLATNRDPDGGDA